MFEFYEEDGPGTAAYKARLKQNAKARAKQRQNYRCSIPALLSRQPITAGGEDWREPVDDIFETIEEGEKYREFIEGLRQPVAARKQSPK